MTVQRHFFVAMLAAAVALPVFAQTVAPAAVPDFSGIWAHPYFPGFEPPAEGPGPIVNRSRIRGGPRDGVANANQFVGDYTSPILKPGAAEVVRKHGEISLRGETYPTPSNQCWPSGVPYIFFQHGMQMLQTSEKVTFVYLRNHESAARDAVLVRRLRRPL